MASSLSFTFDGVENLQKVMEAYGQGAGRVVQEVYRDFAADEIKSNILPLVHSSGRVFKGHRRGAKQSGIDKVFGQQIDGLSLTVKTNRSFGYLYFPDDGSNTRKHAGQQHFMQRGLDKSVQAIVDRCVAKLQEEL